MRRKGEIFKLVPGGVKNRIMIKFSQVRESERHILLWINDLEWVSCTTHATNHTRLDSYFLTIRNNARNSCSRQLLSLELTFGHVIDNKSMPEI